MTECKSSEGLMKRMEPLLKYIMATQPYGSIPAHIGTVQGCGNYEMEDKMRRRLKYFFMNPCEKWQAKRKFPWKLVLQLVKLVLVTAQLAVFGFSRSSHVEFLEKTTTTFRNLYMENWGPAYETMPYPPSAGPFSVYTIENFYSSVNYAMKKFDLTQTIAIGTYHFTFNNGTREPMKMCKLRYRMGKIFNNQSFTFDSTTVEECFDLKDMYDDEKRPINKTYDIKKYLESINKSLNFDGLIKADLIFELETVHLKSLTKLNSPDCYRFKITITYDNSQHNGQMLVSLKADEIALDCHGEILYKSTDTTVVIFASIFDVIVLVVSLLSLILCLRSIFRAYHLEKITVTFFKQHLSQVLTLSDRLEFLNMWYILIIINDVLTIAGSVFKLRIENKVDHSYEICGVLLGTGNLLVWFGVLRYLGFFEKYNVLILTMKKSAPNVLRFLLCAGVFYFGFTVCGWVILGPYHIKFRQISTASECLFSLINGDDMFVTFSAISNTNTYVWWYSRVYLYTFISFFIYVVLSVFISVIMDTYETIKHYYEHGFPKTPIHEFIDQCTDDPDSPAYRSDDHQTTGCSCFPCIGSSTEDVHHNNERTSLLT